MSLIAHAMTGNHGIGLNAGFHDQRVKSIDRASLIQAIRKYRGKMDRSGF